MSRLRRLDDEFVSGELWTRPGGRVTAFMVAGIAVLALGVGFAWLALTAALSVPGDQPAVWLGLPLLAVAGSTWIAARRFRRLAVAFGAAGVLTLLFFAWLFGAFGEGMNFA